MQKMIAFYHEKDVDMLKLSCTLPNLANICLHKSTDTKFYPFTEAKQVISEKIREDVVGGPFVFLHAKQFLMKLLFQGVQPNRNQLLGLMLANYIHIGCVNPCLPFFYALGSQFRQR